MGKYLLYLQPKGHVSTQQAASIQAQPI